MKLLLLMATTWAQEGAEHAAEHGEALAIPWGNIFVQAFNLFLLVALLTYLLRKTVKQHFAQRAMEYKELVDRAENARKEAEKTNRNIKDKLAKLEAGAKDNVTRAEHEAQELRERLLKEAKTLGQKLAQEAQRTAVIELEKAKSELRHELLEQALHSSSENLKKSLGSTDQKNLQNEFVEKIEMVGR